MPTWNNLSLPNASSPLMEQMIYFHDHTMMILLTIISLVLYMTASAMNNKLWNKMLLEGQELELIWTSIPALLLILIAFPSLQILYLMEENSSPSMTIKINGHQWYWSYQYSDFKEISFDSFMKYNPNLNFRLMDVDLRLILPSKSNIRMMLTSTDVIHSWTIPTMGLKTDAIPGRINQIILHSNHPGLFYGQCSEICGINHSFMPITLEILPNIHFIKWLKSM